MFLASSPLAADPLISASAISETAALKAMSGQQVLAAELAVGLNASREGEPAPGSAVVVTREKIKGISS